MSALFLANVRMAKEQVRHVLYLPGWMSVLFNGMISGLSVLFLTDLREQNKTDSEILSCLSYSRVRKGPILVSVLFHTS